VRAKRVDANQKELVEYLRKIGVSVFLLHGVGQGFPDIACGYGGLCFLAEIKTEKGKDTKAQTEMMKWWTGGKYYLRNKDDCDQLKKTMQTWLRLITDGIMHQLNTPLVDYPPNDRDAL
jgi:hypothetical protein